MHDDGIALSHRNGNRNFRRSHDIAQQWDSGRAMTRRICCDGYYAPVAPARTDSL
jgi:hypothetical protein